ncbi:MAG: cyclic nucleotide-binding domain-containing protein [Actinomycetota bacterium]
MTSGVWTVVAGAAARPRRGRRSVWNAIRRKFDPAQYKPKLADDIEIKEFHLKWGNDYAMIANPRDLLHFRLEPEELEWVRMLDGTRTIKQIVLERFQESGDLELDGVVELIRALEQDGFLDRDYVDAYRALDRARRPSRMRRFFREFGKTLSVEWKGAHRFTKWVYDHGFKIFFKPVAVVMAALIGVVGTVAFVALFNGGRFSFTGDSLGYEVLLLLILNYVITFIHELAHALVIVHYKRRVKSAGFMIFFGSPAFFIESSDTGMLGRRERMIQAAAGPLSEGVVAAGAALYALAFPDHAISIVLYKFAVLNYFVMFMNLIPLIELDGYWILTDLIQIPDLRPRAISFLRFELFPRLRRRERLNRGELALSTYGVLGVAFAAFSFYTGFFFWRAIFGDLVLNLWNGGIVTRLFLLVLAVFLAGPLIRGAIAAIRALLRRLRALWESLIFRLQRSWRVEAAELIDELPIFGGLPEDVLSDLAGRVSLRSLSRGEPVFFQGDRPDAFYVVRQGTVEVVEENPESGAERVIRTLQRGQSFGELGLLQGAPRTATVRASGEAKVFAVDKGTFEELLADTADSVPDLAPTLQSAVELRSLPPFSTLAMSEIAALLEHGDWVNLPPGKTVFEQGEVADAFYAIGSGQVEVIENGRTVRTLGAGDYFGEVALLLDVPRTAAIRTKTPVRSFRVDREGFDAVLARSFARGTLRPHLKIKREQRH